MEERDLHTMARFRSVEKYRTFIFLILVNLVGGNMFQAVLENIKGQFHDVCKE